MLVFGMAFELPIVIRCATGIEALVWLTDVAGLSRDDAVQRIRWSAQALLRAAITENDAQPGRRRSGR